MHHDAAFWWIHFLLWRRRTRRVSSFSAERLILKKFGCLSTLPNFLLMMVRVDLWSCFGRAVLHKAESKLVQRGKRDRKWWPITGLTFFGEGGLNRYFYWAWYKSRSTYFFRPYLLLNCSWKWWIPDGPGRRSSLSSALFFLLLLLLTTANNTTRPCFQHVRSVPMLNQQQTI